MYISRAVTGSQNGASILSAVTRSVMKSRHLINRHTISYITEISINITNLTIRPRMVVAGDTGKWVEHKVLPYQTEKKGCADT
jgi:hypothetical protein